MSNILEVNNVSLKYRNIQSVNYRELLHINRKSNKEANYYTALNDITFSLERGDCLGVIGANGAGKSTLLRLLADVYEPDSGSIVRNCDTTSLLSLGIGFQSRLTGRKNILISGLALGFTKKRIAELENDIIEFSELGDFIDKPVKTYSSGMYSKLSFSISVFLESDLLLIDEVLSVGDIRFRKKSSSRLKSIILQDYQTVIIVSHAISSINELCNKVLWLDEGKMISFGYAEEILPKYIKYMNA